MDRRTELSKSNYNKNAMSYETSKEGRFTLSYNVFICDNIIINDGDAVLDVACGNGRLLKMLSRKAKIKAIGVDVAEEMVKIAKAENPSCSFAVANADRLPFEDHKFDAITVCCAFHHFTKPNAFMKEAYRVLKSGGKLYISDPFMPIVLRQLENIILQFLPMGDVKLYGKKELEAFFKKAGFENVVIKQKGSQLLMEGVK